LVALGLSTGLLAQLWAAGWTGVGHGLVAALCCLAALIAPFARKKLGGGDVKLAMVVGTWTSVSLALSIVIFTALLTGVIAALCLLYLYFRPDTTPPKIPVAVPLFLTTLGVTTGHLPNLLLGG
jgi:Flp pilus assembly protein protease CpaA